MSEWNFIIAAYALSWATIAGYAVYVWRCARRAEAAVAENDGRGGGR